MRARGRGERGTAGGRSPTPSRRGDAGPHRAEREGAARSAAARGPRQSRGADGRARPPTAATPLPPPTLIASIAYSTWKRRPSGENVLTPRSYSERVRNMACARWVAARVARCCKGAAVSRPPGVGVSQQREAAQLRDGAPRSPLSPLPRPPATRCDSAGLGRPAPPARPRARGRAPHSAAHMARARQPCAHARPVSGARGRRRQVSANRSGWWGGRACPVSGAYAPRPHPTSHTNHHALRVWLHSRLRLRRLQAR